MKSHSSAAHSTALELVELLRRNDRRALARALSVIESTHPRDAHRREELLTHILPHTGAAWRIGITGSPGAGKSTLIEVLGMQAIGKGHRVAVLAFDPAGTGSGGSILGDKLRMSNLANHPNAFIRPASDRGGRGALAPRTREAVLVCEAAGYDFVLVETVGAGQSDTAIDDVIDMVILVTLPNAGDEVQALKRGVMEAADVIVVTKADLDAAAARRSIAQLQSVVQLLRPKHPDWQRRTIAVSSHTGEGIEALMAACEEFFAPQRWDYIRKRRTQAWRRWFDEALIDALLHTLQSDDALRQQLEAVRQQVEEGTLLPPIAARYVAESLQRKP